MTNAPVTKLRSVKTLLPNIGVKELKWSTQSPDLNPTVDLWDELEPTHTPSPNISAWSFS